MASSHTIQSAALMCRRAFISAMQYPALMEQEWAENRLADFKLWTMGAGALAPGRASLDHRLSSHPETHTVVVNLILMLEVLVEDSIHAAEAHASESASSWAMSTEEVAKMREIEDSLAQLARITVAIRKAGTRSRLQKADAAFDPSSASLRAFRQYLEVLLVLERGVDETSNSLIEQTHRRSLLPIQMRLVEANLRRRHRFLYAQRHAEKLGEGSSIEVRDPEDMAPPTIVQSQVPKASTADRPQAHSATTATGLDGSVMLSPNQERRAVTTVLSQTTLGVTYPSPPSISEGQEVFTCPCCYLALPAIVAKGTQWKKHLLGDTLPYTCIMPNCKSPMQLYMTQQDWKAHMDREHAGPSVWRCRLCTRKGIDATFEYAQDLETHLGKSHRAIKATQIPALVSSWCCTRTPQVTECPICGFKDIDQDSVLNHVVDHIHVFALTSLPWPDDLVYGDDLERPGAGLRRSRNYTYFAASSSKPAVSTITFDGLSDTLDDESVKIQQEPEESGVTEELLKDVGGQSREKITGDWLETLAMNFREFSVALRPDDQDIAISRVSIDEEHSSQIEARDVVEASLKGEDVRPNSDDKTTVAAEPTGENDAALTSQRATKPTPTKRSRKRRERERTHSVNKSRDKESGNLNQQRDIPLSMWQPVDSTLVNPEPQNKHQGNEYQTDFYHQDPPAEDQDRNFVECYQQGSSITQRPSHYVSSYPLYGTNASDDVYWNTESIPQGNLQEHVSEFPQPTRDPYSSYPGNLYHEVADDTWDIPTRFLPDADEHPGNHASAPITLGIGVPYPARYPRNPYFTPDTIHNQLGAPTALDSDDTIEGHYAIQESSYFRTGKVFAILWKFDSQQARARSDLGVQAVTLKGKYGASIPGLIGYMVVAKVEHNATWCFPINTYGGLSASELGLDPSTHTFVYAESAPRPQNPDPGLMTKRPIRISLLDDVTGWNDMSRLDFSRTYRFRFDTVIRRLGHISGVSLAQFLQYAGSAGVGMDLSPEEQASHVASLNQASAAARRRYGAEQPVRLRQ